jgi:hypothetical protein
LSSIVSVVTDFCRNVVDHQETEFAFRLAAYELVENLIKYNTGDFVALEVGVHSTKDGPEIVLVTKNQTTEECLREVDERLNAAERTDDPVGHFDRLVLQSLETPGESRLGLGRLRAEGNLLLSHRIDSEGWLIIEVSRPIYRGMCGSNHVVSDSLANMDALRSSSVPENLDS